MCFQIQSGPIRAAVVRREPLKHSAVSLLGVTTHWCEVFVTLWADGEAAFQPAETSLFTSLCQQLCILIFYHKIKASCLIAAGYLTVGTDKYHP